MLFLQPADQFLCSSMQKSFLRLESELCLISVLTNILEESSERNLIKAEVFDHEKGKERGRFFNGKNL